MRTVAELVGLAREAARVLWRFLAPMTFWYAAGFVVHRLCTYLSVVLGAGHSVLATLVFVIGLVAMVAAMILTIQCCAPAVAGPGPAAPTRLEVLSFTIGPFLAAYALWGLVDEEVSGLFITNIALNGLGGVDEWSVNLRWIRLYVILAVVAWLARQILAIVSRRVSSPLLLIPTVLVEGLWVVAWLLAAIGLASRALGWLRGRAVWQGGLELWYALLARLPDLSLPFDLTLPQAVTAAAGWFWQTFLPGLAHGVLLPLVWLALTAVVFGWRLGPTRELIVGSPLEQPIARVQARWAGRTGSGPGRLLLTTGALLTGDLRAKFLPVAQAFRLVLRAGPRFVGAYLVLAAVAVALPTFAFMGLDALLGPASQTDYLARLAFNELVVGWIGTTTSVAVYVAALGRVGAVARVGVTAETAVSAPPTPARPAG